MSQKSQKGMNVHLMRPQVLYYIHSPRVDYLKIEQVRNGVEPIYRNLIF